MTQTRIQYLRQVVWQLATIAAVMLACIVVAITSGRESTVSLVACIVAIVAAAIGLSLFGWAMVIYRRGNFEPPAEEKGDSHG